MTEWLGFWKVVLVAALVIYTAMAVLVGVKALDDIRELVRFLTEEHA